MSIQLPLQFVANKFYQYSSNVKYYKNNNSYRGCCPICKEGHSLGKKTRLNYYVDNNLILCYNCNRSWNPLYWIKEISGHSIKEILKESKEHDYVITVNYEEHIEEKPKNQQTLPFDSINLSDDVQTKYYNDNRVVQDALRYIKTRRLDTAINRCNFWISLKDYIHKNRLVIPFHDTDKKIRFYQTRALYKDNENMGKYLSKLNSDKTIYGLNTIDESLDYLFIFEGPIDSMFVINGISMAGLKITNHQKELLNKYFLYKRIWILDNQIENTDVHNKNLQLINDGETVFIWPKQFKRFKDVNEICCSLKLNQIEPDFFIKNSFNGFQAKTLLNLQFRDI
jgi:hypothetical protein